MPEFNSTTVDKFLDTSVFNTEYRSIPLLKSKSVDSICSELQYAILTNSKIFIYGDYDCDGLYSVLVWRDVFDSIGYLNYELYRYTDRVHTLPSDFVYQVLQSKAEYVLINDTGCSISDHDKINQLRAENITVLLIDHHISEYNYKKLSNDVSVFNTSEEAEVLNGDSVSCAYAALLVANVLCRNYLKKPLPNSSKVFALASMYSDVVSMSSETAVRLYNNIKGGKVDLPPLFAMFNTHNYKISSRLFQFQINNRLNAVFRYNYFDDINLMMRTKNAFSLHQCVERTIDLHAEITKLVSAYIPK